MIEIRVELSEDTVRLNSEKVRDYWPEASEEAHALSSTQGQKREGEQGAKKNHD